MLTLLEKQQEALTNEAVELSYFSNGSVAYHDAWYLSHTERVKMYKSFSKYRGNKKEYL